MIRNIKQLVRDVLYVSKLTGISNKKLIVLIAVILSQMTAISDVLIIVLFAGLITGNFEGIEALTSLYDFVIEYPVFLPVLVLIRFACIYFQSMLLKNLELNVNKNLKIYFLREIFDKRNYSVADSFFYINVLSGHISFFYSSFTSFLNSLLQIVAYSFYLALSDSRTILIFIAGAVVLFLPIKSLIKKARNFMHSSYIFSKTSNEEVQRVVENLFLIKILKKEREEIDEFSNTLEKFNYNTFNNHRFGAINSFLPSLITMFVFSILVGIKNISNMITLDFIGVTLRLFQSLGMLTSSFNQIVNSHVHIEKFYQIETNKLIANKENFKFVEKKNENIIEIKDLKFKYFNSEDYIFENLNLEIKKNTHTILTGPNGSGKSTLLGLLSGVFYSETGIVNTYTEKFAYIGAIPLIFSSSLRKNILYGNNNEIQDSEILDLLKMLNTFKEASNYDLDKEISNKTLSSGQMQKIAFVRALLANPEILLLDESTANLDDESRKTIFKILRDKKITIFNSTHDPDQFLNVDRYLNINIVDEKRVIKERT